ncbi:tetratricopeptide repeat protein 34 [Simochromis diagramma]|uniref:tetratricopeptide repeat protein 34 n=1 Tax=Simochromis diagramma TaxID=43689 RepID=UPI001A7E7654|nr:tetratricopeptide repeat protein 34 [Simochromis diagramma]XP_039903773.1 tetratricopeptide repeat protein 34 [Simochromis diagramma]
MTALVRPGVNISELCKEGDKFLRSGELERATSLYMSAFRTHATSAVSHMRKLDRSGLDLVIATLEGWLDSHVKNQPAEGLNKGLAAVFLSTLSPNNLLATIYKMESLLQSDTHACEEILARCTAMLEGKRNLPPEGSTHVLLEITRALACLLSESHRLKGLKIYLKAYRNSKSETVTLVKSRQAGHLPKIVKAFAEQIMLIHPTLVVDSKWRVGTKDNDKLEEETSATVIEFLLSISPSNKEVQELNAAYLFLMGRFMDSAEAYSSLLQYAHGQKIPESTIEKLLQETPERTARLLTSRAAACFSAGGKIAEECTDLGKAFETHPATARIYFQKLFKDQGTGVAACNHLRQQAERGLSDYRDQVLVRADLRSTEGVELLDPVITQLRTLCHLEPGGGDRELRVRLADCLLLRGEHKEAFSICSQLAAAQGQQSYQNTVHVLRGYARLLSDDQKGALEDFQAVIEHNAPHPSSCVRALCGRGLLRMMGGLNYLTALDYVTASRLHPQETAFAVRCLVPWNYRGLLFTVLLEQGRFMLEGSRDHKPKSSSGEDSQQHQKEEHMQTLSKRDNHRSRTPAGVHSLALLLMELQPSADGPQILAADALYQLGRVEEAYRLLLSIGPTNPRAPILARLALLQLHRGFLYDTNQLLKKLILCGDTSCLRPLLAVAQQKDRALLQGHSHSAAKRILDRASEESAVREAVAYLSIAIMASGGEAAESLLERARCYALLGQRKTAIFDFSAILKEHPKHVHALCGRGFTYLMLNQQKECTHDILAALQINADIVTKDILSLKDRAQKLVCDWLHQFCRTNLSDIVATHGVPCHEEQLREAFIIGGALMRADCRNPRWHLLYVDILLAKGEVKSAGAHLCQVFGQEPRDAVAQARVGVVDAWQKKYCSAARRLSKLAEKDSSYFDFLLALIPFNQRKCMAQEAAQEANSVSSCGQWKQALTLLTVAVQSGGSQRMEYLHQRAVCLAQLGLHERAISDLDRVIQKHDGPDYSCSDHPQVRVEDLCLRGRSLVLCSKEGPALEDFIRALELNREQAIKCVEAGLGKLPLAECFLRGALQHYGEQHLSKAWTLIECGLLLDSENTELRRLRAKVKREVANPCNVN